MPPRKSFLERNRTVLLTAGAGIVLVAAGVFAFFGPQTAPAYACSIEWQAPASTPSPGPSATARLGYLEDDMGRSHVPVGTKVTYVFCPPASGNHYTSPGIAGPIPAKAYGPNDKWIPQNWIHNLEHGALVLLYSCPGSTGDGCTSQSQAALQNLFTTFPNSPVCNIPPGGTLGPVIARFDDMKYPYAALVWDEVLPLQTLDAEQIKAFFLQQAEKTNPEKQCAAPTATPGPTVSTAPSASPSEAPAAGTSGAPASLSPGTSTAPAAS